MEKFFVFDNFLANPDILFNSDKYKQVLDSFIANGRLKGAQLTHYHDPDISPPQPHVKIGGWFANPNDNELLQNIKDAVSEVGGTEIVSQKNGSIITLNAKSTPKESTNLIACYAYKLSKIAQLNELSLPESYAWIATKFLQLIGKEDKIGIALNYMSGSNETWNINKAKEISILNDFIAEFAECVDAQLNYSDEDLGFILERFTHLCNNTSCKSYADEKIIYKDLFNIFLRQE